MTEINERDPHLRGLGFYNPAEQTRDKVTFVGVGGIGSFAAFGAAKLGVPSITLIDPDEVEAHNYGNQMYDEGHIGVPKVSAMRGLMHCDDRSRGFYEAAPIAEGFEGVVVSGLDSMEARAEVWQAVKFDPKVPLYVDGRIGGQNIVVYCVNPMSYDDCESYEKTLHSDDEGVDLPCTERGVIDVGLMIGSVITRILRRHFTGESNESITYVNQENLEVMKGGWVL